MSMSYSRSGGMHKLMSSTPTGLCSKNMMSGGRSSTINILPMGGGSCINNKRSSSGGNMLLCSSSSRSRRGNIVCIVLPSKVHYKPRPAREDPSEWFSPSNRMLRECTQWDERGNRFLTSIFDGGMGAVPYVPAHYPTPTEEVLVDHAPRPGLSNLGFRIDYPRNRVVCVASDKHRYTLSTIVAYDYTTWNPLFVVELQSGLDNLSLADDLALDPDGNIYVTDTKNGKIWKVKSDGSEFCVFCNDPLFQIHAPESYYVRIKVNGIIYHPKGFFLVSHLGAHTLFKVSMDGKKVTKVGGLKRELRGDGIALLDDNRMVMTGLEMGIHILATTDDWETAIETHHSPPPTATLLPTSISVVDGHPFAGFVNMEHADHNTIMHPFFLPL